MGVVYKARQISIDRVIALKMLNRRWPATRRGSSASTTKRRRARASSTRTRSACSTSARRSDGRLFMTMEFLDGMSLRDALRTGPLAPQRVIKILIQCCASLAEAHSIGIIHRDIKPDNVFLLNMAGSPDFVKLLDFSVAKLLEGDRHEDAGRRRVRNAAVHVARAGPRPAARRAQRPLRARHPRVRDADRQRAVQRREPDDGDPDAPARAACRRCRRPSRTRCSRSCGARSRRIRAGATSRPAR